ncbi:unnamed protein product [Diamesa hyperborea]
MELNSKNSNFIINNAIYKVYKTVIEKKEKKESIDKEADLLISYCSGENSISSAAVLCIHKLTKSDNLEVGIALNWLLSAVARVESRGFCIVADGIIDILLLDLKRKKSKYVCPFGIQQKKHPLLTLLENTPERMLYLSKKIDDIILYSDTNIKLNSIEFLHPVLLFIFCNDMIYSESTSIWQTIMDKQDSCTKDISNNIFAMRRTNSKSSIIFLNSLIQMSLRRSLKNETLKISIDLCLFLAAVTKKMVSENMNPKRNLMLILETLKATKSEGQSWYNILLILISEIFQISSIDDVKDLMKILKFVLIDQNCGNEIMCHMILDGIIQVLAYPSFENGNLDNADLLLNYIQNREWKNNSNSAIDSTKYSSKFLEFNLDLKNAYDICLLIESTSGKCMNVPVKFNDADTTFWTRNQLLLRGLFHSYGADDIDAWRNILLKLITISMTNEILKSSLIMPLLFKLANDVNPRIKLEILQKMIKLGAKDEVFNTIKALTVKGGLITSMSIDLHLRLWKVEPRTYPYLHRVLLEKASKDEIEKELDIVKAAAIRDICELRPQNGSDLVSLISEILNRSLEGTREELAASLSIDSICLLCQNYITNIVSTWKVISLTVRYEKRSKVLKSLSKFFALVPTLKSSKLEYENLYNEILVTKLWNPLAGVQNGSIIYLLDAMKSYPHEIMSIDQIPEKFRENMPMPDLTLKRSDIPLSDLEVPGDCFVQLICKLDSCYLDHVGDLLINYISTEINEFRSGTYIVPEKQSEPMNWKKLSKKSILKAVVHFVILQATTSKTENLVDQSKVVCCLRILSHNYSRPLPPLNWCFLHELIHKTPEMKRHCVKIAAKQSVISGTAKRLIENFLLNVESKEDILLAYDVLSDVCNGASTEVLRTFLESTLKNSNNEIMERIKSCFQLAKSITNRDSLEVLASTVIAVQDTHDVTSVVGWIPPHILDCCHLPLNKKIIYRFEVLKNDKNMEQPTGWLNELIEELMKNDENQALFLKSLFNLIQEADHFPRRKWVLENVVFIQNKMVEKTNSKDNIVFLLQCFIVSIITISGYYHVLGSLEKVFQSENIYNIFPQSLELMSVESLWDNSMGTIFEFLHHIYLQEEMPMNLRESFKTALILSKDHLYFGKSKVWLQFLSIGK